MISIDETEGVHVDKQRRRIPAVLEHPHQQLHPVLEVAGRDGPVEVFFRSGDGIHVIEADFRQDVDVTVGALAKWVSDAKVAAIASKERLRPLSQFAGGMGFARR